MFLCKDSYLAQMDSETRNEIVFSLPNQPHDGDLVEKEEFFWLGSGGRLSCRDGRRGGHGDETILGNSGERQIDKYGPRQGFVEE